MIIHDGWGISKETLGNAIAAGDTTNMDRLAKEYEYTELEAHGNAVGVKEGQMGSSEVGHLNIGAGRVVWQDIVRIDKSFKDKEVQPNVAAAFEHAKAQSGRLHFMGLVSSQ